MRVEGSEVPGVSKCSSRAFVAASAGVIAALSLLAPMAFASTSSPLSPRLRVLSSSAVRSLGPARQSQALGLDAEGAGSLLRQGRRVIVQVHFGEGAETHTGELRGAGAEVIDVSPRYETTTVAALPSQLPRIAAVPGVEAVQEETAPTLEAACPQGSVVSEGDEQLRADRARELFGFDGSGITVGVLSDAINQAPEDPKTEAEDVASGDLPGPGNPCGLPRPVKELVPLIRSKFVKPEHLAEAVDDEGRAMAQIVHDIAPGADLDFASALNGELAMAKAIRDLQAEGAEVIVDDVLYGEPYYQDGPVAVAVAEVVAKGVSYFAATGNDNVQNVDGEDVGSWEAPAYRGTSCPAPIPAYYDSCMNFSPRANGDDATFGIHLDGNSYLGPYLQWAQPWNGVTTDLDLFLVDEEGKLVEGGLHEPNTEPGRQRPEESVSAETGAERRGGEELQMVIARCDLGCGKARSGEKVAGTRPYAGTKGGDDGTPRLKLEFVVGSSSEKVESEYPPKAVAGSTDVVGPTVFGHAGAAAAIAVGAIAVQTEEKPETSSSRGPVVHLFGPVRGTAPAPRIGKEFIAKPNLTASDCGATTFFYPEQIHAGHYYFCGTSAAAPHAAGVAALVRSADPGASEGEVRADLEATAAPIGFPGERVPATAVGAGLVDAQAAVSALAFPPTVTILRPPPATGKADRPSIAFSIDAGASATCSIDGGAPRPCTSPYVPSGSLADGRHRFDVIATDAAGRSNEASVKFRVDTTAPVAGFAHHPEALVRTRRGSAKVGFRLTSDDPGATLRCRVDGGAFEPCGGGGRLVRRFGLGRHMVGVDAIDPVGNVGPTAVFAFGVERIDPRRHHGHGPHGG